MAVGKSAKVDTQNAIAIGTGAHIASGAVNSVAIGGQYAYAEEDGLGGGSEYLVEENAKNSTVVGTAGLSQSEGGVALGKGARVTFDADNSAALGTDSSVGEGDILKTDTNGVVSFGSSDTSEGFTRRLINVSDGVNDSDAATVGQLAKATEKSNAAVTANEKKIGSANLSNGSADLTEGINTNTASIQQNSTAIQENTSAIQQNSNAITSLNTHVRSLGQEIDSVGALSAALAGLHPIDYDGSGSRFQISAAAGTYDGKQAVALGGFYHVNRDVMFSLGVSSTFGNDRKAAGNFGVTFRVGPGASQSPSQTSSDVEELRAEVEALKAEIQALKAR